MVSHDRRRRKKHFQSACFTDQPRQTLRAAPTGDYSEANAGMRKRRIGRGDPPFAGKREIKRPAETVAVYSGNRDLRERGNPGHQILSTPGEIGGVSLTYCPAPVCYPNWKARVFVKFGPGLISSSLEKLAFRENSNGVK